MSKSGLSPTQRSLAHCKDSGWTAQVVERWNQFAKVRQDLFGFIDLLVLSSDGIVGVQCTSTGVADRVQKIDAEPRAIEWLKAGGRIEVWGWRKLVDRGDRTPEEERALRKSRKQAGRQPRRHYVMRRVCGVLTDAGAIEWTEVNPS